jgi:hypothetical protein
MSTQSKLSSWKRFFLSNKELETSNLHLDKIKRASSHLMTIMKSFEEISKNPGVSFLILDPTESHLQILHHGNFLGGNWSSPTKKLVAVLGINSEAQPVQIVQKTVKNIKEKSYGFAEFSASVEKENDFIGLDSPDLDFTFKNILPIPIF